MKKEQKDKRKGFTLIEVLATIVIISVILGIAGVVLISIINSSKETTTDITLKSIKRSANTYVQEYDQEIVWDKSATETGHTYTCVPFQELVNKDYLDQETREKYSKYNNIIVTRDANQTIIDEQLDDDTTGEICGALNQLAAIPKESVHCANITYDGNSHDLIINPGQEKFEFINYTGKTNAGYYDITAKLKEGYTWEDSTTTDKTITCQIKKATPTIELNETGTPSTEIGKIENKIKSNINGNLSVRSSNPTYVTSNLDDNTIKKDEWKDITIEVLASRETPTYLTFTLTPDDKDNYYNASVIFEISNATITAVEIPTKEAFCNNLTYNKKEQDLVKTPKEGYKFINTKATNAGDYTITAKLEYGYKWNLDTNEYQDVTFNCTIKKAIPVIQLNPTSGEVIKTYSITTNVTAPTTSGTIKASSSNTNTVSVENISNTSITPSTTSTITLLGTGVTPATTVTVTFTPDDTNNYYLSSSAVYTLKVTPNEYTLIFNSNGGDACNPSSKIITHGKQYGEADKNGITWCTPTRTGYTFLDWYTKSTGGTPIKSSDIVQNTADPQTIYAQWSANNYAITYNYNDGKKGSLAPTSATYNTSVRISNPTKEGYTFAGWTFNGNTSTAKYGSSSASITTSWSNINTKTKTEYFKNLTPIKGETVTMTANWTANTYKISYNLDDGKKGTYAPTSATYNTSVRISNPTKEGYTFAGWTFNGNTSTAKYGSSSNAITTIWSNTGTKIKTEYFKNLTPINEETITMTANWTPRTDTAYKVEHYLMNTNGSYPSTPTSTQDLTGTTAATLTLTNLKSTATTYNVKNGIVYSHGTVGGSTVSTTTILADGSRVIKLYYKRTYGTLKIEKGNYISSVSGITSGTKYYYGATVPSLSASLGSATGYTYSFSKWTSSNTSYITDKTGNPTSTFTWPAMPEGTEITLTANATRSANSYTVTFNGNKFSTLNTSFSGITVTYDHTNSYLTLNGTLTASGNAFMLLTGQSFSAGEQYKTTLTYISGSYTNGTNAIFALDIKKSSGGSLSTRNFADTIFPTSGSTTSTLTVNTTGASEGGALYVWLYRGNTAVFNNYKIKVNITKVESKSVTYNSTYGNLPTPTRHGYDFAGWYTSESGGTKITSTSTVTTANNHTLYAHWTAKNYTVTVNKGTGISTVTGGGTYSYGSSVTINATPSSGYSWSSWSGTHSTTTQQYTFLMPAYNVTDTASATVNSYTFDLNWTVNGTSYGSGYNSRVYAGLKIGGVDQGYVQDYYQSLNYGTSWEIYGLKLDGVVISYSASGKIPASPSNHTPSLYTLSIGTSGYGTVSATSLIAVNGATYSVSGATLSISDGRKITASPTAATGYTTVFSSWSPTSGTFNNELSVTANFTRTANTYNIKYDLNGGTAGTYAPTSATYDTKTRISNPTKPGHEFAGWTFNGNTSTAKYGTSASVTNSWSATTTKVKNQYFKNLTPTSGATVTLTANWTFILTQARSNGAWNIWSQPGYVYKGTSGEEYDILDRTANKSSSYIGEEYNKDSSKWNNVVYYNIGIIGRYFATKTTIGGETYKAGETVNGKVFAYLDANGNPITNDSNYFRRLGNKSFIKIYVRNTWAWSRFTQNASPYVQLTSITDKFTRLGNTYYGVWIADSCTPASNNNTCPNSSISLVT